MRRLLPVIALLCVVSTACTSTKVLRPSAPRSLDPATARVLLMPLDVELYELAMGGVVSPRADWTEAARAHLERVIEARLQAEHIAADPHLLSAESPHLQLFKLHETIGAAIYQYQAGGPNGQLPVLPTLRKGFDWSLGEGMQALQRETGADYALFLHVRDSYATAGRKAAMVGALVVGVVTGVYIPVGTGVRTAFASLVDLRSGEVVWFNRNYSETGDLREAAPAEKVAAAILKDFPL